MEIIIPIILLLLGCVVLGVSSSWLLKSMNVFTAAFGLRSFVAAAVIMAVSTSLPELFVGIQSALNKESVLSFGNVMGSNIIDITLVLGIAALVGRGIRIEHKQSYTELFSIWLLSLAPVILFIVDKNLSRADGVILLLIFVVYVWQLQRSGKEITAHKAERALAGKKSTLAKEFGFFLLYLALLFIGAHIVVRTAIDVALAIQLSPALIGLFLIGFGTSLPELVFQSKAAKAGKGEFALGDALGSVACNSTLIIGITAVIHPFSDSSNAVLTSVILMPFTVLAVVLLIAIRKKIGIVDAIIMILSYSAYAIFELYLRGF